MAEVDSLMLNDFVSYLLTMPSAHHNASGKEITMRCPFCGDSNHDKYKTSFYINIDPDSDNFLGYICFRAACGVRGVVNEELFDVIGYHNTNVYRELTSYLRSKSSTKLVYKSKYHKELSNVIPEQNKITNMKLSYINNRLGLNLSYEDIFDLKICLDFGELLKANRIQVPFDKTHYYQNLSDYGIGFISAYNDYCIIRDISKSGKLKKRYTNINIFDNYDNVSKNYCIPTSIDLLDPDPCVINITEGAFDILGVYYHLNIDRGYKNQIFIASCGAASIVGTLMQYIKQYGLLNIKINVFSDSDVPIESYDKVRQLKQYVHNCNITVYYNTISKDFGVRKDQINISKIKLC